MKKLILTLTLLALALFFVAAAEYDRELWEIFEAGTNYSADFDNDETEETMRFATELDEYDDGAFTLTVGNAAVAVENCIGLEPTVYAMKAGYGWYYYGTLFMVNEYGPSDDPLTYCFLYTEGELIDMGMIPALVNTFDVSADGVIRTRVRANMVGTWSRDADFVIATGSRYDEDDEWHPLFRLCEVPRTSYPMGMMVTLKLDVKLSSSVYDMAEDVFMPAGTSAVLLASDDVSRLFVSDYSGETKGWLAMKTVDWQDCILVGGAYVAIDDVFDDILYAD